MITDITHVMNSFLQKKVNKKFGFDFVSIVKNWDKIVGKELSDYCFLQNIIFSKSENIMYIKIKSSAVGLQILYCKQRILNNIAIFFGYKAINEIKTILA